MTCAVLSVLGSVQPVEPQVMSNKQKMLQVEGLFCCIYDTLLLEHIMGQNALSTCHMAGMGNLMQDRQLCQKSMKGFVFWYRLKP